MKQNISPNNISLVSILIPVYNTESFLERCLDSVINQTYNNIEIIVVIDGSTDSSYKICQKYKASTNKSFKIIEQQNQGQSVARNVALDNAKGKYISFVDSDDWIELDMIEKLVNFSVKYKLEIVECSNINTTKNTIDDKKIENQFIIETREECYERIIKYEKHSVWRRIYTKQIIGDFRFNVGKLHQDQHFTLEMISRIKTTGYTLEKLYIYNTSNESAIRSPFNQLKIDSIDQVLYLNDYRKYYNKQTQVVATNNILAKLKYSYHELYKNQKLDPKYSHRKKIKSLIIQNHPKKFKTFIFLIILLCPVKLYKIVYSLKF